MELASDLSTAVEATITGSLLREALLQTDIARRRQQVLVAPGELQRNTPPLEIAAQILRSHILAKLQQTAGGASKHRDDKVERTEPVGVRLLDSATYQLPTPCVKVAKLEAGEGHLSRDTVACPECRRPVHVEARVATGLAQSNEPIQLSEQRCTEQERRAYVLVLNNGSSIAFLQALLLGTSLQISQSGEDSHVERLLLHSHEVPEPYVEALSLVWSMRKLEDSPRLSTSSSLRRNSQRLLALSLHEFDKVLVLSLGLLADHALEKVFDVCCPAGLRKASDQGLDFSVLLLQPGHKVFERMEADFGYEGPAWPPRGLEGLRWTEEYLKRFFETFFSGTWHAIPEDLGLQQIRSKSEWEKVEQHLTQPQQDVGFESDLLEQTLRIADKLVATNRGKRITQVMQQVRRRRCTACSFHDAQTGVEDPVDGRWKCRLCWAQQMLEAQLQERFPADLSDEDTQEMAKVLGPMYLHEQPQQRWIWAVKVGRWKQHWIELRPRGVVWTGIGEVGVWNIIRKSEGPRKLEVVIQCGELLGPDAVSLLEGKGHRPEVRMVFALRQDAAGGSPELVEEQRDTLRLLGFWREHPEASIRCWPDRSGEAQALPRSSLSHPSGVNHHRSKRRDHEPPRALPRNGQEHSRRPDGLQTGGSSSSIGKGRHLMKADDHKNGRDSPVARNGCLANVEQQTSSEHDAHQGSIAKECVEEASSQLTCVSAPMATTDPDNSGEHHPPLKSIEPAGATSGRSEARRKLAYLL